MAGIYDRSDSFVFGAGYAPAKVPKLEILTAADRVGVYDTIHDPIVPSGRIWDDSYPSTRVPLVAK